MRAGFIYVAFLAAARPTDACRLDESAMRACEAPAQAALRDCLSHLRPKRLSASPVQPAVGRSLAHLLLGITANALVMRDQ